MKKLLLLLSLSAFSIGFSQSQDLTKKQALTAFKNSDIIKELKIPLRQFNFTYNQIVNDKKNYNELKEKNNVEKPYLKNAIAFSNKNSKQFVKHFKDVYDNWHGNDKEMLLTYKKEDFLKEYPINK